MSSGLHIPPSCRAAREGSRPRDWRTGRIRFAILAFLCVCTRMRARARRYVRTCTYIPVLVWVCVDMYMYERRIVAWPGWACQFYFPFAQQRSPPRYTLSHYRRCPYNSVARPCHATPYDYYRPGGPCAWAWPEGGRHRPPSQKRRGRRLAVPDATPSCEDLASRAEPSSAQLQELASLVGCDSSEKQGNLIRRADTVLYTFCHSNILHARPRACGFPTAIVYFAAPSVANRSRHQILCETWHGSEHVSVWGDVRISAIRS